MILKVIKQIDLNIFSFAMSFIVSIVPLKTKPAQTSTPKQITQKKQTFA